MKNIAFIVIFLCFFTSCTNIGRKAAKELSKEEVTQVVKKEAKSQLKESAGKVLKNRNPIAHIIPSGHGGLNAEGLTIAQIVKKPILDHQKETFRQWCSKQLIPSDVCERILEDFSKARQLFSAPVNGHVDFSPVAIIIGKFPTKEELEALLLKNGMECNPVNIRKIHYDIARKALAEKYGITYNQAKDIIGNQFNHVIHEAEDGTIQLVPKNIHDYFQHSGLVSKRMKEITGQAINESTIESAL